MPGFSLGRTAQDPVSSSLASPSLASPSLASPSLAACRLTVACREDLQHHPVWHSTFCGLRKDHRYYEIIEESLRDRFDYGYFVIEDASGCAAAIQPYFLLDQDLLEGIALLQKPARLLRSLFPRFMKLRTLMVGCSAGEGHIAGSDSMPPQQVAEVLAADLVERAVALKAQLVVLKEYPAEYREALRQLPQQGFARVPSMPMTSLEIEHASFDEYVAKGLRSHARRHLRKNFEATAGAPLDMAVTTDIAPLLDEAYRLYLEVFERAKFRFEKLTVDFFRLLGERMGDKVRFFTWRRANTLVAFGMCMIEGDALYLEYLGLDYTVALDLHLYYYTFRDMFDWAARNGYRRLRSSGLSYDPKLHLRYRLYPIDLYVRHVSPAANVFLRPLLPWLVPARYDETLKKFPNYAEIWT